ncbi:MAG TPA: SigE family RNA polymerase sigma factor [Candidatus Limnocylindrales bacterium]
MGADFAEFVLTRTPALLRFAFLLTADEHLAEDLTQEALVRVHGRWSRIQSADGPEPYVRKAILRQYLSWRRLRRNAEIPQAQLPDWARPDHPVDQIAERDELWAMLATLPRAQRAVLVLRYYEDLPDADIAALLDCTPATVRVHAFKALKRLRAIVSAVPILEDCDG